MSQAPAVPFDPPMETPEDAENQVPRARTLATESELTPERIFTDCLTRGVADGAFAIDDLELTALLIKPLLQDWYVKRAKYRKRNRPYRNTFRASWRPLSGPFQAGESKTTARPAAAAFSSLQRSDKDR